MKSKIFFLRSVSSLFLLTALVAIATSCKKDLDINTDPNVPGYNDASVALVLPAGELATTAKLGGDLAILGGIWSQYYTQSAVANQYKSYDAFDVKTTDVVDNSSYDILFSDGLKNYQYVIDSSKSQQNWSYYLMATVMKAYTTGILVDLYDKIPYSQALQGTANLNPAFDDGYTIYQSLISSIDTALGKDFTAPTNTPITTPGYVASDLVFGGDISKWKQFANTLKLKFYLRMVNAHPSVASAGIISLFAAADSATFLSVDASVTNFTDVPNKDNPMYEQNIRSLNTPDNLRASVTLASWLAQYGDTRCLKYFGDSTANAINQGDFNGTTPSYATADVFVEKPTDPVIFISAAESAFLQSEADLRYLGAGHAKELYDTGVARAFEAAGQANEIDSFILPGKPYDSLYTAAPLEAIITQKWLSFPIGCHEIEGFFERNRTGFPVSSPVYSTDPSYIPGEFVIGPNSVLSSGLYPKRLVYPYDETSRNTSAPALVPITTAVWWGL
ncbi:MAG TPA: SusD/RagB family nutrient-binding outer membrane lipoprotein [Ferruginibacter sp.]|nr:SusD/RagB family nutrient-binding outer membrane lipoprotein [Ferruginibacter sp.]